MNIDRSLSVAVTGATGYVAGWIIKRLLEEGLTIHATVRDPEATDKLKALNALADGSPGTLKFFKADLLSKEGFADVIEGCGVVFHTASPFTSNFKDPQRELIDPALIGTRNVLETAKSFETVKRVVVTSSCAAIYTDATECDSVEGGVLTEANWNETASIDYQPYSYSKTLAEREAWRIAEDASFDLVTINPCLVMGPAIGGIPTSESFSIIERVGSGEFKQGAPRLGIGFVDVREVAEAHLRAAFTPEAVGRFILSGHCSDLLTALLTLQARFGKDYKLPKRAAPKWLVWLLAPFIKLDRKFIANNVNIEWRADNSKSREVLGIEYRPLSETMNDMFEYWVEHRS